MNKVHLSGCVSLLPNNLLTFQIGDSEVPVLCGKDCVITGSSSQTRNTGKLKINFKEDSPIRICKLSKGRFVIVAERKIFLYTFPGSFMDTFVLTESSIISAASSSEENGRFYIGLENGSVCYLKATSGAISLETTTPTPNQITSMANSVDELVTCDERGTVKLWNIKFASPSIIWSKPFSDEIFTCSCLTPDGVILGTLFGKIIVLQKGKEICKIWAHTGSVSSITIKSNSSVSPQLCLSTGEDGNILIFTSSGSVIKNENIGEFLLTGAKWAQNGQVMLAAYGVAYTILHPIQ